MTEGDKLHRSLTPAGPTSEPRRRFLGLLGGLGAASLVPAVLPRRRVPRELALKQADFYRPHDLAG
jgi:hypothetical protein